MECYVCDRKIDNSNKTQEHIIINAAGGRLKSEKLICRDCNSKLGERVDSELAKSLNQIANLLAIDRQRGEVQPIRISEKLLGKEIIIEKGGTPILGKPIVKQIQLDNKTYKVEVTARNKQEIKGIFKGLHKKYPNFDVEDALKNIQYKSKKIDKPLTFNLQIGGDDIFRAICKCAINYYIYTGGNKKYIKHLIPYIMGDNGDYVWYFYKDKTYTKRKNECFHTLHLIGDNSENFLYCYVDYFNIFKFLVLLNNNYYGEEISETYCFDVISKEIISKKIDLNFKRADLLDFFIRKEDTREKLIENFEDLFPLISKRMNDYKYFQILKRVIFNVFEKYKSELTITQNMVDEITKGIIDTFINDKKKYNTIVYIIFFYNQYPNPSTTTAVVSTLPPSFPFLNLYHVSRR